MGTIKADRIGGLDGTKGQEPIVLSGDSATLGSGVIIGSAVTGTLGSAVTLPASHITIGGNQSGMTTRNGVLKWGDSQIGSVTGSTFSIDNTGSVTKIVMETNGIIMIVWQGISSNNIYWRINKNTTSSQNSESSSGMAYAYQTHGQVTYHGYASENDYFCCEASGALQNTADKCFCSIVGFKIA